MGTRNFGRTGMKVSTLGLGGNDLNRCSEQQVDNLIGQALDLGFNVLDTAECYKESEERIGRALHFRREDCYVFTKCGHADDFDLPAWSPQLLEASIERSLRRLRTDHLDMVFLHSCSLQLLQQGDLIACLKRIQEAGKVRFIGYSGDREAARFAIKCGAFDALELSLNIADQEAIDQLIPLAQEREMGVVAKRSLANNAWKSDNIVLPEPTRIYQERLQKLNYDFLQNDDATTTALRFVTSTPGIHTAIVGTINKDHLRQNVSSINAGPLPQEQYAAIRARWKKRTWWRKVLPGGRLGWRGWV
ncbi:MAG: aldo/keto reductase [Ktedonobacteraceae bacterium]|nr:aldo/keto reductase [Ktedonobacteraceae bacterium]